MYNEIPIAVVQHCKAVPLGIMVRGTMEWLLDEPMMEHLFQQHAPDQYTRELTVCSLVKLFIQLKALTRSQRGPKKLAIHPVGDELTAAVLLPEYPLVVVVHDEAECQMRNPFEQSLIEPVLRALADSKKHGLDALDGMGIVVPHRAQRAALQQSFPELCILDATTGMPVRSAIDTVERFQGGERTVIIKRVSVHTYGNMVGRDGRPHVDYFAESRRKIMAEQHVHLDPEWETFTYGDPTTPKRSLRTLKAGDLLVFYCGLQEWDADGGWNHEHCPALYLAGFFQVALAGMAGDFDKKALKAEFGRNFHVRHRTVFEKQKEDLELVKGGPGSRLFQRAHQISSEGKDRAGKPLKVLSPAMRKVFGDFGGHVSIQRSPPRWVDPGFVGKAIEFVMELE